METTMKKVYDYKPEAVRDRIVSAFRGRRGEATTADLVALTGLPVAQVQAELQAVSDEYGARLRVTESGEILYSFPGGMKSRYRGFLPSLRRGFKAVKKGAAAVLSFLFKLWIVVMLVGYFLFFVALALVALFAGTAVSMSGGSRSSRDDRRGGGVGGLWIAGRLLDTVIRIWFYSELFRDPAERRRGRFDQGKPRRPLYKAVFSFVFGDGDPDSGWDDTERRAVVAFLRANRGIMSLPEFMAITGLDPYEAERRINRYLYEFEGSPEVSPGGAIYYSFKQLLLRGNKEDRSYGFSMPVRPLASFSSNSKTSNRVFCAINAANILFGAYFLRGALAIGNAITKNSFDYLYNFCVYNLHRLGYTNPAALLGVALGLVPLAFSVLFYVIPAIRSRALARRNEAARFENLRRVAYRAVMDSPVPLRPEAIPISVDAARPRDPSAAQKILDRLAAWAGADPRSDGSYDFPELAMTRDETAKLRAAFDPRASELGKTVFDTQP